MHAGDHGEQLGALGVGGQEAERGVRLQHVVLRRTDAADLEEVVHHRDVAEADPVGGPGYLGEFGPERCRAVRPGEIRNLQTDVHQECPPREAP